MISTEELSDIFVERADNLVADFDLVEVLYHLSERAATICDAAAVGILLADQHGDLRYVAASTDEARLLELFQIQNSEGPCYDCFHGNNPVINSELATSTGWPIFAPRAIEAGFHAVGLRAIRSVAASACW